MGPAVVEPLPSARSTRGSHLVTPSLSFLDEAACPEWYLSSPSLRTTLPTGGDRWSGPGPPGSPPAGVEALRRGPSSPPTSSGRSHTAHPVTQARKYPQRMTCARPTWGWAGTWAPRGRTWDSWPSAPGPSRRRTRALSSWPVSPGKREGRVRGRGLGPWFLTPRPAPQLEADAPRAVELYPEAGTHSLCCGHAGGLQGAALTGPLGSWGTWEGCLFN